VFVLQVRNLVRKLIYQPNISLIFVKTLNTFLYANHRLHNVYSIFDYTTHIIFTNNINAN